jgi:hypothetical protein
MLVHEEARSASRSMPTRDGLAPAPGGRESVSGFAPGFPVIARSGATIVSEISASWGTTYVTPSFISSFATISAIFSVGHGLATLHISIIPTPGPPHGFCKVRWRRRILDRSKLPALRWSSEKGNTISSNTTSLEI